MVKTRKTISVDQQVWERTREEAKRLRVSHSWVAETALRKLFRLDDGKPARKVSEKPPAA